MDEIAVIGAAGFLGRTVLNCCLTLGLPVRAIARRPKAIGRIPLFLADVRNPTALREAVRGSKVIIHAAGLAHDHHGVHGAQEFEDINAQGVSNVCRAAVEEAVPQVVLVSSIAVYGPSSRVRMEVDACVPDGAYARSKLRGEMLAREVVHGTGTGLTILRMATMFGEDDPGNIARLIHVIDRGRFLWLGDGSNRKSLLHVTDAARACIAAAQDPTSAVRVFNVACTPATVRDIVTTIAAATGRRLPAWHMPSGPLLTLMRTFERIAPHGGTLPSKMSALRKWLQDDMYDSTQIEKELGFRISVELVEGLRREVEWYRSSRRIT